MAGKEKTDTIEINVSCMAHDEVTKLINDSTNNNKTIILRWNDGSTVTLSPEQENAIEPYLNTTKTMYLTANTWHLFDSDDNWTNITLKVTNKKGNPGQIGVKIETDAAMDNLQYNWALATGYTALFLCHY